MVSTAAMVAKAAIQLKERLLPRMEGKGRHCDWTSGLAGRDSQTRRTIDRHDRIRLRHDNAQMCTNVDVDL